MTRTQSRPWQNRGVTFGRRISGVLRLDAATFEEIERDDAATGQALAVVVIASVAAGLGAGLLLGPGALVGTALAAVIGWIMWAGVTYVLGARLLPEPQTHTTMGQLLRVIGFSYAPNVFALLVFVPVVGGLIQVAVAFWLLAATVVAVRQALDYRSTLRAFGVVLIGWMFFVAVTLVSDELVGLTPRF